MILARSLRVFAGIALVLALGAAGIATRSLPVTTPSVETAIAAIAIAPATTTPDVYPVEKVVDGDTIDVLLRGTTTRIRIIGMDTPELFDPRKPVQCFAREASAKGHTLLEGTYVRLEYEPSGDVHDKYGRTLAYVFLLGRNPDAPVGTSYEQFMIREGFAHEYAYDKKYKYQAEFKAAQASAKAEGKGFWATDTCTGNTTKPAGAS